ncbi:hypothetical protein [Shimazuella soli]|uniref:hypothetical protein n=1 Tax=Shimazuella soli TaxID=1892854 RepID=UPI001F0F38EC|nr:hypothetical protein [Shimazuella soli]
MSLSARSGANFEEFWSVCGPNRRDQGQDSKDRREELDTPVDQGATRIRNPEEADLSPARSGTSVPGCSAAS